MGKSSIEIFIPYGLSSNTACVSVPADPVRKPYIPPKVRAQDLLRQKSRVTFQMTVPRRNRNLHIQ